MTDENTNLDLWACVSKTDPEYTKPFTRAGGFRGTAINATWLAMRATEQFGPIGIGWGVVLLEQGFFGDGSAQVHHCHIRLWYERDGKRGEIEHVGCTNAVTVNKDGVVRVDEDAPKKSLTDATTKALSMLGFAADVHLGRYDDNKYVAELVEEKQAKVTIEKAEGTAATVLSAVTRATSTSAIDAVMKQYAIAIKAMEKTAKASYDKVKATVQARREELNQKAELTPAKE